MNAQAAAHANPIARLMQSMKVATSTKLMRHVAMIATD